MINFTAHKNKLINIRIASHLEQIAREYCRHLPEPEALVLVGGFSRGEGSVIHEGRKIEILNNYDIVAVVPHAETVKDMQAFESSLARVPGITGVDLYFIESNSLRRLKFTMFSYDLKTKGYVFFGSTEVLNRIPKMKAHRMPVKEGRILLLRHLFSLLESYIEPEKRSRAKVGARDLAAYQAAKTIIACGTAMLMLRREYHPGYRERCRRFNTFFPREHATGTLLDLATRYKLFPSDAYSFDVWDLWSQAHSLYVRTFRRFYETTSEKSFPRWIDLCRFYRKVTLGRLRLLTYRLRGPLGLYRPIRNIELAGLSLVGHLSRGEEDDELPDMVRDYLGRATGKEYRTVDLVELRREYVRTFCRLHNLAERVIGDPPCIDSNIDPLL